MQKSPLLALTLRLVAVGIFISTFSHHLAASDNSFNIYYSLNRNFLAYPEEKEFLNDFDDAITAFNAGLEYEIFVGKNFSIASGLDYSLEGYNRNNVLGFSYNYTNHVRYQYLGIPLTFNYYFLQKGKFKVGLNLGLNFKLLLNATYKPINLKPLDPSVFGGFKYPETYVFKMGEFPDYFNTFNINTISGIRFVYELNAIHIGLSPEFKYSLKPLADDLVHATVYSFGVRAIISLH